MVRELVARERLELSNLITLVLLTLVDGIVIDGDVERLGRKPQDTAAAAIQVITAELGCLGRC